MLIKLKFVIVLLMVCVNSFGQSTKINAYLIPGQGADYRLYNNLQLPENYNKIHVKCPNPQVGIGMKDYARQLISQIDTSELFIVIGVSLGGMLATELTDLLYPHKTVLISSAKCNAELPQRYKAFRKFPLNRYLHPNIYKMGAQVAQPIVEPDRKHGKDVFKAMLRDKDPQFLKRTSNMIINWDRTTYNPNIIHIHGTNDHTIPFRNVKANYKIEGGSHMMVYTRAKEINEILCKILSAD